MTVEITQAMVGVQLDASAPPTQWAELLVGLRNAAERARTRLMLTLLYIEQHVFPQRDDWGHESFDGFLKAHEIVRPDVYRDFVAGLEALGDAELAERLGVNVVHMMPRVPKDRRSEYVANMLAVVRDKGAEPSAGAARDQARHCGMLVTNEAAKRVSELETLRLKCARLEQENAKLRREVAKLQKGQKKATRNESRAS
jgi:hypothetical protein